MDESWSLFEKMFEIEKCWNVKVENMFDIHKGTLVTFWLLLSHCNWICKLIFCRLNY